MSTSTSSGGANAREAGAREAPPTLLIHTKLNCPATGRQAIVRPRLLARLQEGLAGRVTLVSAPAGYGKTTLAVQWLDQTPRRVAWLALEPDDSEVDRFLRYLVAALQTAVPGFGRQTEALLSGTQLPPPEVLADTLVGELGKLRETVLLVLDDYHSLHSEAVQQVVVRLIAHLPGSLHLAVLTRGDPPWPLPRWRALGWVNELRTADLSFSEEEVGELLQHKSFAPETVHRLHQRTEGWIAGLQLMRLSLAHTEDKEQRARNFAASDALIVDYLMDEVIAQQPAEVRDFLAVTALFDRFCAPLCAHVLAAGPDGRSGERLIAHLERDNLFLISLDRERRWYRYHHLFRDLLENRLAARMPPERRSLLQRRAGEWFAREGLIEEALRHWIAGGDLDSAAALVGEQADVVFSKDPSRRALARWLALFPSGAEHGRIPLLVAHGYLRILIWDLAGLGELLEEADRLTAGADGPFPFRSNLEALKSFLCYWQGQAEDALRHARVALGDRPRVGGNARTLCEIYRAASLASLGRLDEALRLLDEAVAEGGRHGHFSAGLVAVQGFLHLNANELDAVRRRVLQLLAAHDRDPIPEYWLGQVYYLLGVEAYERNRLEEAEDRFRQVEGLRYLVTRRFYMDALIGLALVARARGDRKGADAHAAAVRAWAVEIGDLALLRVANSFEMRLDVMAGRAPVLAHDLPPPADHQSFWLEVPSVTWAERLVAEEFPEARRQALPFIESALERMEKHHNLRQATVLSVLRAMALDAEGRRDEALASLAEILRSAAPRRLVRTFLDRGPRLKQLLDELSARGARDGYLELLQGGFSGGAAPVRAETSIEPSQSQLTNREMDVLLLLERRLSYQEIADQLCISPNTVRRHAVTLYRKLDVRSGRQAVAAARREGVLLSPLHDLAPESRDFPSP